MASATAKSTFVPSHSKGFLIRRVQNWLPLGLFYMFLYFGRYNLTVAKNALGGLMTNEDFGVIFFWGTIVYGVSFLLNGPLTDRYGGRLSTLVSAVGAALANLAMGFYIHAMMHAPDPGAYNMRLWMSILYTVNMYFQSFGAVSIVKVNSYWFHVNERGIFSGIFGMLISGGIFLAFSVNGYILEATKLPNGTQQPWLVFFVPAGFLAIIWVVEFFILRERPGQTRNFRDFDTGDASSGDDEEVSSWAVAMRTLKKIITNPLILTIAFVELCTGVLRQGVMHWGSFYFKEVWVLPGSHGLRYGVWNWWLFGVCAVAAVPFFIISLQKQNERYGLLRQSHTEREANRGVAADRLKELADAIPWRRWFLLSLALFLAPFSIAGWGGLLMVAGCFGGVFGGWISNFFFHDRRPPAAFFLYAVVTVCAGLMVFSLGGDSKVVGSVGKGEDQLKIGDEIIEVNGTKTHTWSDVRAAVAAIPATCVTPGAVWDAEERTCSTDPHDPRPDLPVSNGTITIRVMRPGILQGNPAIVDQQIMLTDPKPKMRAGDERKLNATPVLVVWPWFLGALVIMMSFGVIGTHGLLSGVAGQDFGGRKGAATATGIIDGFAYLGTGIQSICLGYLTGVSWLLWPLFMIPFGVLGMVLLRKVWTAKPNASR